MGQVQTATSSLNGVTKCYNRYLSYLKIEM